MIKVRLDDVNTVFFKHLVARTLCLGHQMFFTFCSYPTPNVCYSFDKTLPMSAFLRHWINSTSSHPILSYSVLSLSSFLRQDFSKRFLYCSFSDKVLQPVLTAACNKATASGLLYPHIQYTSLCQYIYVYFLRGLPVDDKTLVLVDICTKELMGNTTVRGEWKTSNSATRPKHRIVSVLSCSI